MLWKAGVDIEKYFSHSTRSVSTSNAKIKGLSLREISKAAGWKDTKHLGTYLFSDMLWLNKLSGDISYIFYLNSANCRCSV